MRASAPVFCTIASVACSLLLAQPVTARDGRDDLATLHRALLQTERCALAALQRGRALRTAGSDRVAACRTTKPPRRLAVLFEDLVALASAAEAPPQGALGASDWRQRRCQRAILADVSNHVRTAVDARPSRRHRSERHGRRTAARRVPSACDVDVFEANGRTMPVVGHQCAAAIGTPGSRVDALALDHCLETLVETWLGRVVPSRAPPRPNIIVIVADDQRHDAVDTTHSRDPAGLVPAMPAVMDRLVSEGVTFSNSFVTNPVCGPSRASLLTGQYTFRHGVLRNGDTWGGQFFDDRSTLATWLQAAGYRTGFYGKYINDYAKRFDPATLTPGVPPGWDDWRAFNASASVDHESFTMVENGEIVAYGEGAMVYSTDVIADQALAFIADAVGSDEPFFVYFNTATPHFPWTPAPRHVGAFDANAPWRPPNYYEADVFDKPGWVQALPPIDFVRTNGSQIVRRSQLAMQLSTDEFVDELVDVLEELGIAEDTAIVFTSDNGYSWGEHRLTGKACPWHECLRVPLIVRYPRLAPLPRVESAMAANIDLAPTIAALAEAELPPDRDGRSFLGAIDGTIRAPRHDILIESYSAGAPAWVGVRSGAFKLIEYQDGERELYDLEADPFELNNLSSDPAGATVAEALTSRLQALWPGWSVNPF